MCYVCILYVHATFFVTGSCSCYFFSKNRIPCKHIFAVFSFHQQWHWGSLPTTVTDSCYMVLNNDNPDPDEASNSPPPIPTSQAIMPKMTNAHKLKVLHRQLHDTLHKCISATYCNNNVVDLQQAVNMGDAIYRHLVGYATDSSVNGLPVLLSSGSKRTRQTDNYKVHIRI